jgi:hypothetical protein
MNDRTLVDIIQEEFSKSFEDAKKMNKIDKQYSNPYTAKKLLFYFSNGTEGIEPYTDPKLIKEKAIARNQIATPSGFVLAKKIEEINPEPDDAPVPKEIYDSIKKYNKDFNIEIFENSITLIQIYHILLEWNWISPSMIHDIYDVKKIVDAYDFDGDGNLNPEEFTIFQIHFTLNNRNQCIKNCFGKIIDIILGPLFIFLDCKNDGNINSENMWEGLKHIYRKEFNKYDIYKCVLPNRLNRDYRTNSINYFILKTYKKRKDTEGFVDKIEFINGILTGIWERQADDKGYGDNIKKRTGLPKRWADKGFTDIECNKILYFFPNNH